MISEDEEKPYKYINGQTKLCDVKLSTEKLDFICFRMSGHLGLHWDKVSLHVFDNDGNVYAVDYDHFRSES